ncbi:hypothetical protein [Leptolyngbya sp. 7M]|uniref:hypothetical protein n=1 Tax=Leptolyngbya sp. 7M TaxID=2812896 RepID=UPI001B8B5B38|nr:hypothetical protein [Leptolyngbya sp. 7M]QYO68217.1 hypothetical protein JVX88_16490 [Leptolyngbya sp. 7M]
MIAITAPGESPRSDYQLAAAQTGQAAESALTNDAEGDFDYDGDSDDLEAEMAVNDELDTADMAETGNGSGFTAPTLANSAPGGFNPAEVGIDPSRRRRRRRSSTSGG